MVKLMKNIKYRVKELEIHSDERDGLLNKIF
jgi:hypothetical protein